MTNRDKFFKETLLEPPEDEWFNECPICRYKLSYCQCLVAGNSHPNMWKRVKVVKDHLYLFNSVQVAHVIWLESKWETSYDDPEMNDILKELKEGCK